MNLLCVLMIKYFMLRLFKIFLVIILLCEKISAEENVYEINDELDEELNKEEKATDIQNAKNYMEFRLGNPLDSNPIRVYTVFSCPHCCKILTKDILQDFLAKHGKKRGVSIKLIIAGKEDIRMLKILRQSCIKMKIDQNVSHESISMMIFWRYVDFAKSLMEHYGNLEKTALDVGLTEDDIKNARPDADGEFEKAVVYIHTQHSNEVRAVNETQEIDVPFIVYNERHIQIQDLNEIEKME